jgi:hypothetical protein
MRVGAAAQQLVERYEAAQRAPLAEEFRTLCSDEYFSACGATDDDFIRGLYRDVLGRGQPPSDAEVAAWRDKLAAHARTDLVVEFFNSQEFIDQTRAASTERVARRLEGRLAHVQLSAHSDYR